MDFERGEIRANRYGSLIVNHEFVAEAVGPDGFYIVARTPQFGAYEPNLRNTLFYPSHGVDQPDNTPFQRKFFNALVEHLVRVGWEPLAESGAYWYSRRFHRRISLYFSDPEPATPYTLGDLEEWRGKALKALDQYEHHRDAKSCRQLAEAFRQLGLALEREHQFKDSYTAYFQAGQKFEKIAVTAEATEVYLRAERVLRRK